MLADASVRSPRRRTGVFFRDLASGGGRAAGRHPHGVELTSDPFDRLQHVGGARATLGQLVLDQQPSHGELVGLRPLCGDAPLGLRQLRLEPRPGGLLVLELVA